MRASSRISVGLGGIEAAQQLVQRAQHLLGERGRDRGLRLAALAQERRQAAVGGVGEQAEGVEQELEAAEHRPAGDGRERAQREGQIAGGLAARRIDEPQLGHVAILAVAWIVPLGDQQAGEDAGLAQQPLEALMRRRLPAVERCRARRDRRPAARCGRGAARAGRPSPSSATAQVGPSVVSCSGRRTNRSSGSAGPPGLPATWRASQPSTCSNKGPGVVQRGLGGIVADVRGDDARCRPASGATA